MKVIFARSDQNLLHRIRSGEDKAMETVYLTYRDEFVHWTRGKYSLNEESALEYYQESVTILFEKIINGSLTGFESSLKTFLFGIGKNRIRQNFDAENRMERHGHDLSEHYRFLAENEEANKIYLKARDLTKSLFKTIEEPCKTILHLFYFEKRSMEEIAKTLNYKNEGVARTTKKRCLEKIRSQLLNTSTHE